jgi:uncharacterized Zn-finger protein
VMVQVPVYACSQCEFSSHLHSSVVTHERTHSDVKRFHCSFDGCGYGALRRWQVTIHERTHTGEEPFPCTKCDKRFKVAGRLSAHFRKKHSA